MDIAFPEVLMQWLSTLPQAARIRETQIAERNLRRILNHRVEAVQRSEGEA